MLQRMKRLGLLAIVATLGCNTTSDGDTDTDGGSGGGGGVSETEDVTETVTDTVTDSANTETASGSATTNDASTSTSDASSSSEGSGSSSTSGSTSTQGTTTGDESTGEPDPQALCESTEGTWEPTACGDYVCGIPNACQAIVPGCDCGQDANFVEDEGCVADDSCSTFDCGDKLQCVTAAQYCEGLFPGMKGAPTTYACEPMPASCVDSVDCLCLATALKLPPPVDCSEPTPDGLVIQLFLP